MKAFLEFAVFALATITVYRSAERRARQDYVEPHKITWRDPTNPFTTAISALTWIVLLPTEMNHLEHRLILMEMPQILSSERIIFCGILIMVSLSLANNFYRFLRISQR